MVCSLGMWKSTLSVLILTIDIVGVGLFAGAQTPQELVEDGMRKQQAGDLTGAVNDYREFLKPPLSIRI